MLRKDAHGFCKEICRIQRPKSGAANVKVKRTLSFAIECFNMTQMVEKDTGLSENIVEAIGETARKNHIKKVCLFGSRARGDYDEKSDIDLAAYGGWISRFRLDIEEQVPTLLMFDIVDMERSSSAELRNIVEREGIVLYEEV